MIGGDVLGVRGYAAPGGLQSWIQVPKMKIPQTVEGRNPATFLATLPPAPPPFNIGSAWLPRRLKKSRGGHQYRFNIK